MSKNFTSTFVASVAILMGTIVSAQDRGIVPVTVQPAASVPVVLFSPTDVGTTLVTTGKDGKGSFNIADLANKSSNKFLVVEEKCEDQTRILLVAEEDANLPASKKCRRRELGAYLVGRDAALNVKLSGGVSAAMKTGLIAGAGASALLAKEALSGDEPQARREQSRIEEVRVSFDGTYNIVANKAVDPGCNFVPSFSGQLQVTTDGSRIVARMIERLTRIYTGTIQPNGNFTASGNGNLNTLTYTGQIEGQVSGNSISGTEMLNIQNGCGKQVSYRFSGNK